FFAYFGFARQFLRRRYVGHFRLVIEARLIGVERHQHGKDRMAVLARSDAPGGEALTVADAVDVVDDRDPWIAGQQEISVHRMRWAAGLDRAHRSDQRLADHLATEHALPAHLRRATAEQIYLQWLKIEDIEQVVDGGGHGAGRVRVKSRFQPAMLDGVLQGSCEQSRMSKRMKLHHDTDVVVGGAGFAGLALAIALRQGLGEAFAVTVVDPALGAAASKDPRASAIAAAARRLFEAINVWDAVADKAQPILDMVVTESKLDDAVRPTFLTFGGEVEEGEPFAHMIENRHLIDVLVA